MPCSGCSHSFTCSWDFWAILRSLLLKLLLLQQKVIEFNIPPTLPLIIILIWTQHHVHGFGISDFLGKVFCSSVFRINVWKAKTLFLNREGRKTTFRNHCGCLIKQLWSWLLTALRSETKRVCLWSFAHKKRKKILLLILKELQASVVCCCSQTTSFRLQKLLLYSNNVKGKGRVFD